MSRDWAAPDGRDVTGEHLLAEFTAYWNAAYATGKTPRKLADAIREAWLSARRGQRDV